MKFCLVDIFINTLHATILLTSSSAIAERERAAGFVSYGQK